MLFHTFARIIAPRAGHVAQWHSAWVQFPVPKREKIKRIIAPQNHFKIS